MEHAAQVKRQSVWWDSLLKKKHFVCKKISDHMEQSQPGA